MHYWNKATRGHHITNPNGALLKMYLSIGLVPLGKEGQKSSWKVSSPLPRNWTIDGLQTCCHFGYLLVKFRGVEWIVGGRYLLP